jgi:lipopolysaccharide export system protein LptC
MNSPPLKAKKKSFWDQPALERSLPGQTYTRFVRSMRLILPLAALGMLVLVMAWPRMEETAKVKPAPPGTVTPPDVGRNELINPRFESQDEQSQPFKITATRAIQNAQDPDLVLLQKPMADITLNNGTWLAAEADSGSYRQDAEKLLLEGNVRLFHDKGYEIKTEKLLLDLKTHEAWSDRAVNGQGPAGTLAATGVRVNGDKELLVFTGPVKLVLNRSVKGM